MRRASAREVQVYAYHFFLYDLVGIDFFSNGRTGDEPNIYYPHGHIAREDKSPPDPSAPPSLLDEKSFDKSHRFPGTPVGGYTFHSVESAGSNSRWVADRNHVWNKRSVCGFQAATAWNRDFADCYLFNPGGLTRGQLAAIPYVAPPAPLPYVP
jgi:hypothetical protein